MTKKNKKNRKKTKQRIGARATAQAINTPHQIYIVEQTNVCRGYNCSRAEQTHA